jgi:hypothetical protein
MYLRVNKTVDRAKTLMMDYPEQSSHVERQEFGSLRMNENKQEMRNNTIPATAQHDQGAGTTSLDKDDVSLSVDLSNWWLLVVRCEIGSMKFWRPRLRFAHSLTPSVGVVGDNPRATGPLGNRPRTGVCI